MGNKKSKKEDKIKDNTIKRFHIDSNEISRLNHLNNMLKKYFGNYYDNNDIKRLLNQENKHILDVKCRTGKWCIEMNKEFKGNYFTATNENTEILVNDNPNIFYKKINMSNIDFNEKQYDFINTNLLALVIPKNKIEHTINNLIKSLKEGGYLQILDFDVKMDIDDKSYNTIIETIDNHGFDCKIIDRIKMILEKNNNINEINITKKDFELNTYDDIYDFYKNGVISALPIIYDINKDLKKYINEEELFKKIKNNGILRLCRFTYQKN
jgi:SAM-dependent methyltransferase